MCNEVHKAYESAEVCASVCISSAKVHTDFLVVEENALTTLQPLLDRFDFGTLVIGASNRRSLAQKLQEEALKYRLHSHSLLQQGALTVSW